MIELEQASGRYRFTVNLVAVNLVPVKGAGLYLSTGLLKLARSVN